MKKAILNAWPSVVISDTVKWQSQFTLELTALPTQILFEDKSPIKNSNAATEQSVKTFKYRFTLCGVDLVMASDKIIVADGLIKSVMIHNEPCSQLNQKWPKVLPCVYLDMILEHPLSIPSDLQQTSGVPVKIIQTKGLPAAVTFCFSRKPLQNLFKGIRIGVDPGHGGKDRGIIGPVNLTEKQVTLEISKHLNMLLELSGAHVIMTRTTDITVAKENRTNILILGKPALCVKIHTSESKDPLRQTYQIAYVEGCAQSKSLADHVALALFERMGIKSDVRGSMVQSSKLNIPIVKIKPLCLTYFADEANFRAPLFKKRLGQSIYNGIARYLHTHGTSKTPDAGGPMNCETQLE